MVVLPAPDGPTRAVVVPGVTVKLIPSRPSERASCWKPTSSNTSRAPSADAGGRSTASGASVMSGWMFRRSIICSMSMKAWRISR